MNSDQIFDVIERIATTPGKKDKESIIKQHKNDETFVKVLQYTYDPALRYGLQVIPTYNPSSKINLFTANTSALLDKLASREYSGDKAKQEIARHLADLTVNSAKLLERIILKDLRAGFSDSTINKAIPGTLPEFPYMRCSGISDVKPEKFPWKTGVYSQEKKDAMYANLDVMADGSVYFSSRQGKDIPIECVPMVKLGKDVTEVLPKGYRYTGELIVQDWSATRGFYDLPREESNGLMNSVTQGGDLSNKFQRVVYVAWDIIPHTHVKAKGKYETPYETRLSQLTEALTGASEDCHVKLIETRVVHSLKEAYQHCQEVMALGKEGTIFKDPKGVWRDGTSKHQVKLKLEFEVELKAIALTEGKGKWKDMFGSVLMESSEGLLEVGVSGLPDDLRKEIFEQWETSWEGSINTVRSNGITVPKKAGEKYSLYLPRFVERRYDKTEADSLEKIQTQMQDAINVAANIA